MSKIIIEFDGIEELENAQLALNAHNWKTAMYELDCELRNTTKYGKSILNNSKECSDLEQEIAEKYRELIRDILFKYNISLD